MSEPCGIYSITNIVNGKRIIGQSKNISKRWIDYKYELRKNIYNNRHLQNAWNKYGEENFRFDIILLCSLTQLDSEEKRLIKENNTTNRNFGYNIAEGGNRPKISDETRERMRVAARKRPHRQHSDATKIKISIANKGKVRTEATKKKMSEDGLGKYISLETRRKMSISQRLRKPPSDATRQKTRETLTGTHRTPETKQKLRIAQLGKHHSDATKKKISESHKKRFLESQTSILA
jgi:group I intron endonuclease